MIAEAAKPDNSHATKADGELYSDGNSSDLFKTINNKNVATEKPDNKR